MSSSLKDIAATINENWKPVNPAAKPYLEAMSCLDSIKDDYYMDSGKSIVLYFLANAGTWRGEVARNVKKQLNDMVKAA